MSYSSFDRLDGMIHKIFRPLSRQNKQTIKKNIIQSKNNIPQTLQSISRLVVDDFTKFKRVSDENRQDFIVSKILKFIQSNAPEIISEQLRIVDIGGGNGNVLQLINTTLGLTEKKDNFICVETKTDWVESYDFNHKNITYMFWNNHSLQIQDNTFDCVLCMVSLHHMTDETIVTTLQEIERILKPGGILLIKEHDANQDSMKFIVWEHHLYHIMDDAYQGKIIDVDNYLGHNIANFKSKQEWQKLIEEKGHITWKITTNRFLDGPFTKDDKNASNLYWDVYTKS